MRLFLRRLLGFVQRQIFPTKGDGVCPHCGRPWVFAERHVTRVDHHWKECSPLCRECWGDLSPAGRLGYYEAALAVIRRACPGEDEAVSAFLLFQESVLWAVADGK